MFTTFPKPCKSSTEWFNHASSCVARKRNTLFSRWRSNCSPAYRSFVVFPRRFRPSIIQNVKDSRTFGDMVRPVARNITTSSIPPITNSSEDFAFTPIAAYLTTNRKSSNTFPLPVFVHQAPQALDATKPPAFSGISPMYGWTPELASINTCVFRLSQTWILFHVLQIPLRGNKSDINNIRHISLTPTILKVLESFIIKQLLGILENLDLLSDQYNNFRRNRLTSELLAYISRLWSSTL